MKILKSSPNVIKNLVSEQKYEASLNYRQIKYCIMAESEDKLKLYNTLTLEIIELDREETDKYLSGKYHELDYLIKHWFLVPKEFNEYNFYNEILNVYSLLNFDKSINYFTILPTTDCNAHCFYCFEHGSGRYNMTPDIAHKVADYIAKVCEGNTVKLKWFGGEPLYNKECIDIICNDLKLKKIDYKSLIVTNGYLFDKETARKAASEWNINKAQITLDGTRDVYNKIKAYNNGDPNPFATVMDCMQNVIDNGIKLQVRLNLNLQNKEDLFELVEYLSERFGDKIKVYSSLLYDEKGNDYNKQHQAEVAELIMAQIELDELIASKNMASLMYPRDGLKKNSCSADSDNAVVILPDGSLGKCDFYIARNNEYLVGDVVNGVIKKDIVNSFKERNIINGICETCPMLPLCYRIKSCPTSTSEYCDEMIQGYKIGLAERKLKKYTGLENIR